MAATLHSALWNEGGGTVDPRTGKLANLQTGFLVSYRQYGKQFLHWPTVSEIANWLRGAAGPLNNSPNQLYPGIWYDSQQLSVWCDLNALVIDESMAIKLAQQEHQLSIRDNQVSENIPVLPARRAA
jgi:hypothetical protein